MNTGKAFKVRVGKRSLDYRLGKSLNLDEVKEFFKKNYKVVKIWWGGRHVFGYIENNNKKLFLKLATTEGVGAVSRVEYNWNLEFNKQLSRKNIKFFVPKNFESGLFKNRLFYLVVDRFDGSLISEWPANLLISHEFKKDLDDIIKFSELIQTLDINNLKRPDVISSLGPRERFLKKTKLWFGDIPRDVIKLYKIYELLKLVENGVAVLRQRPRHGDFAPWHIYKLKSGCFGLIDGEHAMANSVENYDIAYFIQRIFSVLKSPDVAVQIFMKLTKREYRVERLKTVLAARAIGGFLDESQVSSPNYDYARSFKDWALKI